MCNEFTVVANVIAERNSVVVKSNKCVNNTTSSEGKLSRENINSDTIPRTSVCTHKFLIRVSVLLKHRSRQGSTNKGRGNADAIFCSYPMD